LTAPHVARSVAEVWLGQLCVHQGLPTEGLELIDHALVDPAHIDHPFAPLHGLFGRVMALGQLGRVAEATRACDDLNGAIAQGGEVAERFHAIELNARAWLFRGSGRLSEADELNREAVAHTGAGDGDGPGSVGLEEAYWVGWLDLVDGRLAAGDPSTASTFLGRLVAIDSWDGTMAWHQRHRLGLARARVAFADGDPSRAGSLAMEVAEDAGARGASRYEALAQVQVALAGGEGDLDRLAATLDVLRRCACLELPPLLDELGRVFQQDQWCREAERRRLMLSGERW